MKLKDVGERKLLEMAREVSEDGPPVLVGVGDDAAVVEVEDEAVVATTDMLVEGVHFTSDDPPGRIGRKVIVVNLSDLAAMGASPLGLVFSIGAPGDTEVEFISELLHSMDSVARQNGAYLVGGDMNESDLMVISGTAFGEIDEEEILLRSGAEPGDLIGVTGELGESSASTWVKKNASDLDPEDPLRDISFEPVARVEEGQILSESGEVNSAVDITDGLAANLWQISRESGAGLVVDFDEIPVGDPARELAEDQDIDLGELVLYGGEDFELLFTARPGAWEDLEEELAGVGTEITVIGEVEDGEGVRIRRDGEMKELQDRGYEHFRTRR